MPWAADCGARPPAQVPVMNMKLPGFLLACACVVFSLLCGCKTVSNIRPATREAQQHAQQIQGLQLRVMRYADEYVGRMKESVNRLQAGLTDPRERLDTQNWKVQQADAAYTNASGPNSVTNALDMVVLATLSRMVLDDAWVRDVYRARAQPVQATYHSLEAGSWQLLEGALTEDQKARLRQLIAQWRADHPNVRAVAYIHFVDFAKAVGPSVAGEEKTPGSLLGLVGIDPFSGLDPAVREIAQSRELAERAIYYMQRTPDLLDMQIERLSYQMAVMPETRSLLSDVSRVSLIGSASDRLVSTLPDLLDREREALVRQMTQVLKDESATLGPLVAELRATLQAGTDTANAVNAALKTTHEITSQFARPPGAAPEQRGPPFDIQKYTEMLQQASATARDINALAERANALLPVARLATREAAGQANQVLNHLFVLLLALLIAAAAITVLAMLAYRRLEQRAGSA
jgi:hypothetical protein